MSVGLLLFSSGGVTGFFDFFQEMDCMEWSDRKLLAIHALGKY